MNKEPEEKIIHAFIELSNSLEHLNSQVIAETQYPIWLHEAETEPNHKQRQLAMNKIRQLMYHDTQDKRKAITCPGFIACSGSTQKLIQTVNTNKNKFKECILELKKTVKIANIHTIPAAINAKIRHQSTFQVLKKNGLSRLHLKQCYRNIVVLDKKPKKISWTWANTKAINKISISQAQSLLLKKGNDAGILYQQQKLLSLPANEHLAIVQTLAPNLRINILFNNSANSRQMFKGHLPLFYIDNDNEKTMPNFIKPKHKTSTPKERIKRSDNKLSDELFLPAIRAYRYIN